MQEREGAFDELLGLGFRSFPVVARGCEATLCQELQQVADFVGVELEPSEVPTLDAPTLIEKIRLVLEATSRFALQLSDEQLLQAFGGRKNRDFRGLACHVGYVVQAFIDACRGGRIGIEYYMLQPPRSLSSGPDVAGELDSVRVTLNAWWEEVSHQLPDTISTYWGTRPALGVLERTTWHAAQHARQLEAALELMGVTPDGRLGDAELGGLPLPENIFDDELPLGTEAVADASTSALVKSMGPVLGRARGVSPDVDLTSLESIRAAVAGYSNDA